MLPHKCTTCEAEPNAGWRKTWGCTEDAPSPTYSLECPRCRTGIPDCELCAGDGWVHYHRCPVRRITPEVSELMELWAFYHSHGLLPVEGGLDDQTGVFLSAMLFLDAEVNSYLKKKMDKGPA